LLKELFLLTREKEDTMTFLNTNEKLTKVDLMREKDFLKINAIE
jgi:hypothetical protein